MRRSVVGCVAALAVLFGWPGAVSAQVLPPKPVCLAGACHEDKPHDAKTRKLSACPLPATLVCAGSDLVGGTVDALGDVAQAGVEAAGQTIMGGLTDWVTDGAAWLLNRAARLLDRSTRPALGSAWFQRQYRTMLEIAVALSVVFLLCALIQAVLRHDARLLARSALLALPLSILLAFAAVTLVETTLAVTDWMTAGVLRRFERDTGEFFSDVGDVLKPSSLTGSPLPGFLLFIAALLTALATFVVWLELIMREAAIYVAVAFLPLTFAAMVWERTAHWCRRLVEILAAIIVAKFTIAVAVALAAGAMGHGRSGEGGLTALMAGCAVMVIAALTPWLLLRLIPIAEAAGHLALHRGSARAALGTAPGAQTAAMVVRQSVLVAATPASRGLAGHQLLAGRPTPPPAPPLPRTPVAASTGPSRNGGST